MAQTLPISRRALFAGAAGAAALGLVRPAPLAAAAEKAGLAGFYPTRVGSLEVTVFSDGTLRAPVERVAPAAPLDVMKAALEAEFQSTEFVVPQLNLPLIRTGGEVVLIDTGSGRGGNRPPSAGRLIDTLAEAGVAPEDITLIPFTHLHPDHVGGAVAEGAAAFPRARYVVSEREHAFWTDPARTSTGPDMLRGMAAGINEALAVLGDRVERIQPGAEVAPGISAVESGGHTPGHLSYLLSDGDEQLLVTGDIANHWLFYAHPDWAFAFDIDGAAAAETRRRLFDRAASERVRLLAYHLPWPGLGHAGRAGDAFRWVQEPWNWG